MLTIAMVAEIARDLAWIIARQLALAGFALLLVHCVFRRYFRRRRIQKVPFPRKAILREILLASMTLAAGKLIAVAIRALSSGGYAHVDVEPLSGSTIISIAGQFLLYVVLFDAYFYFLHRLMHSNLLWWVHRYHHMSVTPNPVTAFSFHPLEGLLTGGFVVLMLLVFDLHVYAIMLANAFGIINSILIHSGHEVFPRWWYENRITRLYLTPMFHDRHHSTYRYNYGGFTTIWDRVFGTMQPGFEDDYRKLVGRVEKD